MRKKSVVDWSKRAEKVKRSEWGTKWWSEILMEDQDGNQPVYCRLFNWLLPYIAHVPMVCALVWYNFYSPRVLKMKGIRKIKIVSIYLPFKMGYICHKNEIQGPWICFRPNPPACTFRRKFTNYVIVTNYGPETWFLNYS